MCKYCDFSEYAGEKLPFSSGGIDGAGQNLEVYLLDSPEEERVVLHIDGTHIQQNIPVDICPMCGRRL